MWFLFGLRSKFPGVAGLDPAVVAYVDDDGVFSEAAGVEFVEKFAAGLVEPFDHGVVAGDEFVGLELEVFVVEFLGRIVRGVRKEGGVPDEEGLFLFLGFIEEGLDGGNAGAGDLQAEVTVAATFFGVGVCHGTRETVALWFSFPEFSGLQGEVSGVSKEAG